MAIDAFHFRRFLDQFAPEKIRRELNKASVSLTHPSAQAAISLGTEWGYPIIFAVSASPSSLIAVSVCPSKVFLAFCNREMEVEACPFTSSDEVVHLK